MILKAPDEESSFPGCIQKKIDLEARYGGWKERAQQGAQGPQKAPQQAYVPH